MKYTLVALNVQISGKTFRKDQNVELDDKLLPAKELDASYAAGFIKPKGTKAKTPAEVIEQYAKAKKIEDAEAKKEKNQKNAQIVSDGALVKAKELLVRLEANKKESEKSLDQLIDLSTGNNKDKKEQALKDIPVARELLKEAIDAAAGVNKN